MLTTFELIWVFLAASMIGLPIAFLLSAIVDRIRERIWKHR